MSAPPVLPTTYSADRRFAVLIVTYASAGLIAWLALVGAGGENGASWQQVVSPFGWHDLLILHLLGALAIGILLATTMDRRLAAFPKWTVLLSGCVLGGAIALWTAIDGETVAVALEKVRAGFAERAIVRFAWCFALVIPWCTAGCRLVAPRQSTLASPTSALVWSITLLVAVGLPIAYTLNMVREHSAAASEMLTAGRLWKAEPVIDALCDVGSARALASPEDPARRVTPRIARDELAAETARHAELAERPLPAHATPADRIARAKHRAAIGRLDAALADVAAVASEDGAAANFAALILDEQRQFDASHQWYRTAAELLAESTEPDAQQDLVAAYDGLAKTARDQKQFRVAETVYFEAIEALPNAEPYFQFQLGRHYRLGGRPLDAWRAFRRAAELQPEQFAMDGPLVAPHVNALRQEAPTCVLPVTGR